MATKRRYISIKKKYVEALVKSQNVSRSSVYNALNYSSNSETAQQIRRLALSDYGGIESTKVVW